MRRSPLVRKTELRRSTGLRQSPPASKSPRRSFTPASSSQRLKCRGKVCAICGAPDVVPCHVVDRSLGGCDAAACVFPGCFRCHDAYDNARVLDVLPYLTLEEQGHAAEHLGLVRALERTTNANWSEAA